MRPCARGGDMHICPMQTPVGPVPVPHVGGPLAPLPAPLLICGMPPAGISNICTCVGPPDLIALTSFTVFMGGKPIGRMGDMTAHGGSIVVGAPTVLIGD